VRGLALVAVAVTAILVYRHLKLARGEAELDLR
jgi:hypothetical protein